MNTYTVSYIEADNVTVSAATETVEHGEKPAVVIVPDAGYNIEKITDENGTKISYSLACGDDGATGYVVTEAVTDDIIFSVSLKEMEVVEYDTAIALSSLADALRSDTEDALYVFANNAMPAFTAADSYSGIRLMDADGSVIAYSTAGATAAVLTTATIAGIQVLSGTDWFDVCGLPDGGIQIVIDAAMPTAVLIPAEANENGYYHSDVTVTASVEDPGDYSGIADVAYAISSDGAEPDADSRTSLYSYADGDVIESNPVLSALVVDAEAYNSENTTVFLYVTDRAGNAFSTSAVLKINATEPAVRVSVKENDTNSAEAVGGYYSVPRSATITIADRRDTFDADAATAGIKITATDSSGSAVDVSSLTSSLSWIPDDEDNPAEYSATVFFDIDANYQWTVFYTNKAGLSGSAGSEGSEKAETDFHFTVDTTAPAVSRTAQIGVGEALWKGAADISASTVFALWKNASVCVSLAGDDISDATSPIQSVLYYQTSETISLTKEELVSLYQEGGFSEAEPVTVETDRYVTVYARVTDFAGNTVYVGTDGVVVDMSKSSIRLTPDMPDVDNGDPCVYGFYTDDVGVAVEVTDENGSADSYSGIASVDYMVSADGEMTDSGTLFSFEEKEPTQADLVKSWTGELNVEAGENNSDNVIVTVMVTDNAGNTASETVRLQIDVTVPDVSVSLDGRANRVESEIGYFAQSRVATVTITERTSAFDEDAATKGIRISAADAAGEEIPLDPDSMISGWTTVRGDTADEDTHTATITFSGDGIYALSMSYEDLPGWSLGDTDILYTGTAPQYFAVDTTVPTASITVEDEIWSRLLAVLTFGLYKKGSVTVTAAYGDATSPCEVDYYRTSAAGLYTSDQLDAFYAEGRFENHDTSADETEGIGTLFTTVSDEQFVVYLRITDYAGNYTYVNSDGYIADETASKVTLTPSAPAVDNGDSAVYGYYNDDVVVEIEVEEAGTDYAGIQLIEYWIEDGDEVTEPQTLYEFDYTRDAQEGSNGGRLTITDWAGGEENVITQTGAVPTQTQLKQCWKGSVTVDAEEHNSCDVTVCVRTVDNAGNEKTETAALDIDVTAPSITVAYDNNTARNDRYFDAVRTATVVITERPHHFDAEAATEGISITAVDSSGNVVDGGYSISEWTTGRNENNPDEATHRATITYSADANYTFTVSYMDKAANENTAVDTGSSRAPYEFTVDTTAPTGTVTAVSPEGRTMTWDTLLSTLTFGFYSNKKISVSSMQTDATSPVESVEYYKTSSSAILTASELSAFDGWKNFTGLAASANQQFVVYLKVTDMAGNVSFLSTDGLIVDNTAPMEETIAPEITVSPRQPVNGIYNGDVKVSIKVTDPTAGETCSGLKEVRYEVLNMGAVTQSGTLYRFAGESPSIRDLKQTWTGNITVNAQLNNSNDVQIIVYAADNAGNISQDSTEVKIDITDPVIDIRYSNNSADSSSYYSDERTATIVVKERNFSADDVTVTITNTDGTVPSVSGWTAAAGSGNGDDITHTATITYSADGDYTFDIDGSDLAGNVCTSVNYAPGTTNPTEFTIDQTNPAITVTYDNNTVMSARYFDAARTATVTVTEHNFDVSRVVFSQTASLDGNSITVPAVSWQNNGDVHTATIYYGSDGDYTFEVEMADMAGNESGAADYGGSVAANDFTVDLSIEKPIVTGVENGMSYKDDVIPEITFSDINFSSYEITLLRTRREEHNVDVTDEFITEITTDSYGGSAEFDTFEKIQGNDGIYALTVTIRDMAGNEETESVVFTVNRFGSVYVFNLALVNLQDAYVQSVDEELVITEYNPDKLVEGSLKIEVAKDGTPASEVAYEVNQAVNEYAEVGDSGWYQYEYTIDASNFREDGIYRISVSSEDEAGNFPETSNYDECEVLFCVDTIAAEITAVSGLEESIVNAESVDVNFEVFDAIGLKSITVYLDGRECLTCTGEQIEMATAYSDTFVIDAAGFAQNVRFVVVDLAGNILDTDEKDADGNYIFSPQFDFNRSITISTNFFVRWFANESLFWGSIVAVTAVVVLVILLILFKRGKKAKETAEA
ncbi:MAG: hypothetical protein LUC83_10080 [Clostridiales bacterium]|nr:hypothetical protein [Clostridiales bacterium]